MNNDCYKDYRDEYPMRIINGYKLVKTCSACPEQYDVFKDGKQFGYLRLRNGHFYASVPDCSAEVVYEASPVGDGMFDDDERDMYLTEAIEAIDRYYNDVIIGDKFDGIIFDNFTTFAKLITEQGYKNKSGINGHGKYSVNSLLCELIKLLGDGK